MKSCFPLDVRNCECIGQAWGYGVCFMSLLAYFCLRGGWMGGGGEDAIHITWLMNSYNHGWTLICCRCWWSNQMLQLQCKFCQLASNLIAINLTFLCDFYGYFFYSYSNNFPIAAIFILLNINLSIYLWLFFKAVDSPWVYCMRSNSIGSLIYCLLFCYLQTNNNRFEIDNTCRPVVQSVSLWTYENGPFYLQQSLSRPASDWQS